MRFIRFSLFTPTLTLILFLGRAPNVCAVEAGRSVLLWPDGAPGAVGSADQDKPQLTILLPKPDIATRTGIVVNPGGGYRILASDHEGLQVARWLNSIGVAAYVLRYRLRPEYEPSVALLDAKRAIRYVRSHAEELGVSPKRIGMLGFSAGGHLTTAAGTSFDAGDPKASDPIERVSSRPDFLIPIYAAISRDVLKLDMGDWASTEKLVTKDTPPAFLVQTHEDSLVSAKHSLLFYEALLNAGVAAEMHIFQFGAHGTGLAPGDPDLNQWQMLAARWLRRAGFLTDLERAPVKGTVTISGKPMFWGSITLIPEDEHLPIAVAYFGPNGNGVFSFTAQNGPCPGVYRVEVQRVATDFSAPRSGAFSLSDVEVFSLPASVEIQPGANELKVDIPNR